MADRAFFHDGIFGFLSRKADRNYYNSGHSCVVRRGEKVLDMHFTPNGMTQGPETFAQTRRNLQVLYRSLPATLHFLETTRHLPDKITGVTTDERMTRFAVQRFGLQEVIDPSAPEGVHHLAARGGK